MFIYRELKPSQLYNVFLNAAKTTSVVLFLVSAALVTSWLITRANIPNEITRFLEPGDRQSQAADCWSSCSWCWWWVRFLDLAPTILILSPVADAGDPGGWYRPDLFPASFLS